MVPTPRDLARFQALGRVAAGIGLTVAPRAVASRWIGARSARRPGTAVVVTAMGARDLALGLGQARAISNGFGAAPWVAAGVLADATDLLATVRARRDLPGLGVVAITAVAGGSTALGLWLARAVD
jgi:hypothetical protein